MPSCQCWQCHNDTDDDDDVHRVGLEDDDDDRRENDRGSMMRTRC